MLLAAFSILGGIVAAILLTEEFFDNTEKTELVYRCETPEEAVAVGDYAKSLGFVVTPNYSNGFRWLGCFIRIVTNNDEERMLLRLAIA